MAVTVADISPGGSVNRKIFSVIKTADADAAAVIVHALGAVPEEAVIVARGVKCYPDGATTQSPFIGVIDATNVNVTMATGAGSGDAAIQFNVIVRLAHSLTR